MTATYNTVTVGGNEYDVYAEVATADDYLEAEFSDAATRWRDATLTDADAKARALVSATRLLDRQMWAGSKTSDDQELAWPRTGTGISDVDEDVVPQDIINASILIAADINNGVDISGSSSTDERIRSQTAGSVSISYFRDNSGGTRFPTAIQELLSKYLGGAGSGLTGVYASGTDRDSDFGTGYNVAGAL